MRTMKTTFALIIVATLLLTSCGGSAEPAEPKIITIAWTQEPNSLNRSYSSMWYMAALIQLYSCSPWQFDENNEAYAYMLTELPTISEDGLTVTMRLRDDLVWSDGAPLTSDDFLFTYDMITDPGNTVDSVYPYDMFTVAAPDAQTVVLTFAEVFTPWMATIWSGTVMPKHILQPVFDAEGSIDTAEWNLAPTVGCGPFTFAAWESGSYLQFDRNENFWGAPAKLDSVIFQFVPDDAAQTAALLAGDADVGFWPPYEDIPAFQDAGLLVVTEPSGYNEGWFFNFRDMASVGIRDLNVRKAIAMALDRGSNTALRLDVVGVTETFWDAMPAYVDPTITPWPYDPNAARTLLETSGWIDRDGDGIRENADGVLLTITQGNTNKTERQNYQALAQQQLLAVGIDLNIQSFESDILFDSFSDGGPAAIGALDIMQWSDVPAFPDPDSSYWLCDQMPSDDNPYGFNYFGCDETLDALFRQQVSTVDPAARAAIFHQITKYMYENVYYLGIWEDGDVWIVNPRLTGYKFSGVTPFFNIMDWDLVP
ncbi:MAG: peptide ABC transporter substrate-binding protein [Chloroflexi bacterium]|nr:peptide ABC transporter substrate-binding protein [Chloroflexota bacterium]